MIAFHRHEAFTHPDLGQFMLCHRFGRLIGAWYRISADHTWHKVPDPRDRIDDLVNADSPEQIMAIIRKE